MDKYDLISRRELIRNAIRMEGDLHLPSGRIKRVIGIPIDYIRDAPTIDLEDMLHTGQCGTCKYSVSLSRDPHYPDIFCDRHDVYMTQDDFCSRYEARGE